MKFFAVLFPVEVFESYKLKMSLSVFKCFFFFLQRKHLTNIHRERKRDREIK